jgi:RNA polymerase sigma-B factor
MASGLFTPAVMETSTIFELDAELLDNDELVAAYKEARGDEKVRYRDLIVRRHTALVRYLAKRYARASEPFDDLVQVGMVGLLKALERFDPQLGSEFASFARPTIVGELRRYFRDRTWSVRVPRKLQELLLEVVATEPQLAQELGTSPTPGDLAQRLGVTEEQIHECLEAARSYTAASLDQPLDRDGDEGELLLGDFIVTDDGELEKRDNLVALAQALRELSPMQRRILHMRFFEEKVQSEIARELGVSQMQISRILNRVLALLRGKVI